MYGRHLRLVVAALAATALVLRACSSDEPAGDTATTCNDPNDLPAGTVVASGTVLIG